MGSRLLPRDRSAKTLLAHLRSGHPIGIVADHRLDEGAELPFFSKTKATTLSPARLALKAQADLVAVRVERLGPARFRLSAEGPLTAPPEIDDEREQSLAMMTAFNECLERWIRERPGEWICGKRSFGKEWFREFRQRRKGRVTAPGIAGARR
jgi:KDO2-lipid IV(A) lauroyltransferase